MTLSRVVIPFHYVQHLRTHSAKESLQADESAGREMSDGVQLSCSSANLPRRDRAYTVFILGSAENPPMEEAVLATGRSDPDLPRAIMQPGLLTWCATAVPSLASEERASDATTTPHAHHHDPEGRRQGSERSPRVDATPPRALSTQSSRAPVSVASRTLRDLDGIPG